MELDRTECFISIFAVVFGRHCDLLSFSFFNVNVINLCKCKVKTQINDKSSMFSMHLCATDSFFSPPNRFE